jgi:hypothetical protein
LVDEVQAHLARINGAPPGELIANALCQVGHSVTRALLKLGKYLAFGRRVARALDEHVLLSGKRGGFVAGADGGCGGSERMAQPEEARGRTHSSSSGRHGHVKGLLREYKYMYNK